MIYFEIIIFLCSMATFVPSYCRAESGNSDRETSLPKFLSELDLSSVEASAENGESLRKIVKRLAPEKNGVTGQPGVDFPALTTIPATSFSCRGLKGGYYADLQTNCQVFHICDNGRKISFLCPNGTIFQQSQLICDWWFKVDCSKSAELYEQSSEQLLEEERKRAEARKSKLEYHHQTIDTGGQQDYYDVQNLSYDGKQNGRINTYEEPPPENQLQTNKERAKPSRHFDGGNNFSQESNNPQRDSNQLFGSNGFQSGQVSSSKQQFSQFTRNTDEGTVNKYPTTSQDYYSTPKKAQNYHATNRNSNGQRDEKGALKRQKFKTLTRNNSVSTVQQRVTPAYTETTSFRAGNTGPVKESQQFAESAAFVGNRGNRFNENTGNSHQYYYQLYINRDSSTRSPNQEETRATTQRQERDDASTQSNDFSSFTDATFAPYETTTQYATTTVTPPCNTDDVTTETSTVTIPDTEPTPESLVPADSSYGYRGYYKDHQNTNGDVLNRNSGTDVPTTTRSYLTTDNYGPNSVTPSSIHQKHSAVNRFASPSSSSFGDNNFERPTERTVTRSTFEYPYNRVHGDSKVISKNPSTVSQGYRPNFISSTTEKPFRTTLAYQQNAGTEKDLSPYDRSFTYKQGKVMSTLGPYVPFTKNYATSSTSRPTPYTPTVPTYTPAYTSPKTLIPKLKYSSPTSANKIKSNAPRFLEREHALSMLHSLKNLESNVPNLSDALNERTSNVSAPPAPATLHSLALYFSTATENFDSNETTESSLSVESEEDIEQSVISKKSNGTVQVPTSLLTQHTISSYAELFKLNDSFETNNVTNEDRLDNAASYGDDYNEDLELQQSGGSLDDLRKSNSTRLRELAQVFTHALSAYLLDPDTFKRVLTEIRPTEPPRTTLETEQWRTTTAYPITDEDYTSSVREKDEVLDFSDDGNDLRQKLTTAYPTTFEPPTTVQESVYDTGSTLPTTYYPTMRPQDAYEPSTNAVTTVTGSTYFETSAPPTDSTFAVEQSNVGSQVTDNHVPTSDETGSQNRVGGFQNNSVATVTESYEKPSVTTPISDNYVVSPTPSSPSLFVHMATYNWNKKATSKKPEQQLTPPFFESYAEANRIDNGRTESLNPESYPNTPGSRQSVRATTPAFPNKIHETSTDHPFKAQYYKSEASPSGVPHPTARTSYMKFRNIYNRGNEHLIESTERPATTTSRPTELTTTTTSNLETTPCAHTDSGNSLDSGNQKDETKLLSNDYWTSSPAVTHLWETSVFVDPQRINLGLESDLSTTVSPTDGASREELEYGNTGSFKEDSFDSSEESLANDSEEPSSLQRLSREKDSPTTFSLLPTSFSPENTATPKPLITTRSSITTTITSSITSTNSLPQESLVSSLLPYTAAARSNGTNENEIAEKLFGKLNASSSNTLMRVMKQADNNETVRQLVLLLVRHCNDPVNKTMQREKEELLNALLRLPVNEFASEESRNVVAEINQLKLPGTTAQVRSTSAATPTETGFTEPSVTTYRSRRNRKFRTTTENTANLVRRAEKPVATSDAANSLQNETTASDGRALELLRSLYTIATKWG